MGTLYPDVTTISILGLEHRAVTFSAAGLGSTGKFQGPDVVPDDGADAMCVCGKLLACHNDKAVLLLSWAALTSSKAQMWSLKMAPMPSAHVAYCLCIVITRLHRC